MNRRKFLTALGVTATSATALGAANLFRALPHFSGTARDKVVTYLTASGFTDEDIRELEQEINESLVKSRNDFYADRVKWGVYDGQDFSGVCEVLVKQLEEENGSLANISKGKFFASFHIGTAAFRSWDAWWT